MKRIIVIITIMLVMLMSTIPVNASEMQEDVVAEETEMITEKEIISDDVLAVEETSIDSDLSDEFYISTYKTYKPYEDATYELKYSTNLDKTLCIIGYTGEASGRLVIPAQIDGRSVTEIGKNAFDGCSEFTGDLVIPDGITKISNYAFQECVGFTGDIVIPDSVTIIGTGVFNKCTGFNGSLTLSKNLTEIGNVAFNHCSNLTGTLIIPEGVSVISGDAFAFCSGLTGELHLPESTTKIGHYAFRNCPGFVGNLTIPSNVEIIDQGAFQECTGLTGDIIIPDNVTTLGSNVFKGCTGFDGNIVLSNNIITIEGATFADCSGLTGTLTLPTGLTKICGSAFGGCSGLTGDLVIPATVTEIGNAAFYNCSSLNGNLTLNNGITTIGANAFNGCSSLTGSIILPNGLTTIENNTFSGCKGLTGDLKIPQTVTWIKENAFSGCSGFDGTLSLPRNVKTIDEGAFCNCSGLKGNLFISSYNITEIKANTFDGCSGFNGYLVLPETLKKIDEAAFRNCKNLTGTLTIPEKLNTISAEAFAGCAGFTGDLIFPDKVSRIEARAFQGCTGISDVYFSSYYTNPCDDSFDYASPLLFHCKQNSNVYKTIEGYGGRVIAWGGDTTEYLVNYELDGGINDDRNPYKYSQSNSAIKLYNATKPGYKFNGWYYYKNNKLTKITQIPKNAAQEYTIYAKWSAPIKYSISYNLNKGNLKNIVYIKNYTVEMEDYELPIPSREGYTFGGWYTTKTFDEPSITHITTSEAKKVAVYARWEYQVEFDSNSSETTGSMECVTLQSAKPSNLEKNKFERLGYTFKEWSTLPNGKGKRFKDAQIIKENPTPKNGNKTTLYANWKGITYTVAFDPNGGQGKMSNMKNLVYGKTYLLTKNKFKNLGKSFTGWSTTPDGSGDLYVDHDSIANLTTTNNEIITLYAQWRSE